LSAKISFSFLSIHEKNVTCKRDPEARDRDETETFDFQSETRPRRSHISPRPRRWQNASRDRLETETSRPRLHPWPVVVPRHTMTGRVLVMVLTAACPTSVPTSNDDVSDVESVSK